MTRTRNRAEREVGRLTPKPAKPGLSDEEVAWQLHQELNAGVGSPALRTRTRHHDADVREASPSPSQAGQEEVPSAVRVTRSRARDYEDDEPVVSHRPTTRGVRAQMLPAVSSQSASDVDHDDKFDDRSGEPRGRASAKGDITEAARGKKGASSAPGKARMPKIPKLPMVQQDDGSWYRARVIRDGAERVLIEFTGFEHQFPSLWLAKVDERIWRGSYKGKDWKYLGGGAWAPKQARSVAPSSSRLSGRKRPRPTGVPQQEDEGRPLLEGPMKSHFEGEEEAVDQFNEHGEDNGCVVIKLDAEEAGEKGVGRGRDGGSRRLLDPIVREALARGESLMASLDDEGLGKEGGAPTGQHTTRDNNHGAKEMASQKKNQDVTGRATRMKRKQRRDGRALVSGSNGRTPTPETPLGRPSRRASLLLPSPAGGEKLRSWREDEGTTKGDEQQDDCVAAVGGDGSSPGKQNHPRQTEETGNASSHSRASHHEEEEEEDEAVRNKQTTPVQAARRRRKPATCSRAPTGMELDAIACSPTSKARLAREAAALAELERRLEEEEQAREMDCAGVPHPAVEEEVSVAGAVRSGESRDLVDGLLMMNNDGQHEQLLVTARSWRGESGGREEDVQRNSNDDGRSSDFGATANRRQRRKAAGRARFRTSAWSYELADEHGRQDHFAARYEETRRHATTTSRLERKRGRPSTAQHRRALQTRHQEDGLLLSKGVFNTILGALSSLAGEAPPLSRRGEAWGSAVGPATPVAAVGGAGSHSSLTLFNSWSETRWHKAGDPGAQPRILRVKEELFTPRTSSVSSGVSPFDQSVAGPPLPLFQ